MIYLSLTIRQGTKTRIPSSDSSRILLETKGSGSRGGLLPSSHLHCLHTSSVSSSSSSSSVSSPSSASSPANLSLSSPHRYLDDGTEHHAYHADSGQEAPCAPRRVVAFLLYFNEVQGGETIFLQQGRMVEPKCGRVLMFPTSFSHVRSCTSMHVDIEAEARLADVREQGGKRGPTLGDDREGVVK
eukprot:233190-Hanusia_phi.AAC.3